MHTEVPELSIPCDFAHAHVKLDGVTIASTLEDGEVRFPVAKGGTYIIYAQTSNDGGNSNSTPPSIAPSSGSSDSSRSQISVDQTTKNGKVKLSAMSAEKGKTVTVTVTLEAGYQLKQLTVLDRSGKALELTDNGDGTFSFTMPDGKVSVSAVFEEADPVFLPFADVAKDSTFHDAIAWAYENGYMNGKTAESFQPDGKISRQQVWMILARMSGANPANMAEAKAWAAAAGVSDGSNPGGAVTRQQLATMFYRYEQIGGGGFTGLWAFPLDFADANQVSEYAYEALCWCTMNGVMGGYGDSTLRPQNTASRAHMAAMLMRFCQIEN